MAIEKSTEKREQAAAGELIDRIADAINAAMRILEKHEPSGDLTHIEPRAAALGRGT